MKKYKQYILALLFILSMVACSDLEEVIIYHEPVLNIYANVSVADPAMNFVHVYRTTGFGEQDYYETDSIIYHQFYNESSGDTITYQTLYIDTSYAVNDAKVYFLHGADTIRFYECTQGIYELVDTSVDIIVGDMYDLRVETEDFGVATSSEEALPPITWNNSKQDTVWISISDPTDTLFWSNTGGAYNVDFYVRYDYGWGSYTYSFENVDVRDPFWAYDTSEYDMLFNQDPFKQYLNSDWNPDTLELEVIVKAYSSSYLDYKSLEQMALTTGFIRYPTLNDFRVNIDNSLGAFTSMSVSDERVVMFVK
ncbi:MAG: DUF4249 domain-containing protein [Candidatus Marinimicrobia bacterium]|nr:DUF4249 domain-containing protein [Candidatus Neomarinimicrobiota bacterium]